MFRMIKLLGILLICLNPVFLLSTFSETVRAPKSKETDSLKLVLLKRLSTQDKIKTLSALGKAYYNESNLDSALKTEYSLLEVISKHGTKIDSAKCFRIIGLVYMQKSWYDKSLENLERAQHLFGESGDSALQAKALMNIGTLHDYMNNLPMALLYYEKALKYFMYKKDETGTADCKLNMAIVLSKQKKYEQACEDLLSAAEIYKKTANDSYLAAAYINLGLTYKKMGNYTLAIEYHDKALAIWKQQDDEYHICYYYMNMGEIMLDLKKITEAGKYLLQAEKLVATLGSKDLQATTYEYLSDYHAARKNYAAAYSYLDKSKQLNDSILNAETTEKVSQIQYRYEIAKREADNTQLAKQNLDKELELSKKNLMLYILTAIIVLIALLVILLVNQNRLKHKANEQLETKNKLIESQKEELINLNASKDKFLSILAHDIRNPLSSIYSISDILVSDYDNLSEDQKLVFTRDINTLSSNLFEIINKLLAWSTSQSGMITYRPKPFLITDLCRQSLRNLQTVAKQKDILLVFKTDEKLTVMADENMILSVLHNLINNAIKYSYTGSNIRVETKQMEGNVQISVIDTGTGLSAESQEQLFQYDRNILSKGTAGESGTGLGLILCKDFVEKNGGSIMVDSQQGKGSTFMFTLPVA
jgi:signal transduction histidine kinase